MPRLNAEWTQALHKYKADHQDPRNQACHRIGIPLIVASFPVGATLIGLPLAATMFTVGWGFQFAGHCFEGKKPSFLDDRRSLALGVLWCLEKYGLRVVGESPASPPSSRAGEPPRNARHDADQKRGQSGRVSGDCTPAAPPVQ